MEIKKENRSWLDALALSHPLVIAGPCSAETEEQVLDTAHQLKGTDVTYYRAGVWKPRTRPGNFEGVGALALKWLQRVKEDTGLKLATEVANASHVKLCLQYDIDLLWIGARSTVSPFIVQEIADALKGTEKVVLVKNPVNPDLSLWLGAIERLHASDIKNLGVIHRGFSTYEKTLYRNIPEWQMAIDLKNKYPNLPLMCDPSHIGGKRGMVFDISQTALDLNFDGLMIETHRDPEKAWSDATQQVTPTTLIKMMEDLRVRKESDKNEAYNNALDLLRAQIDVIDDQLISMLSKRMDAVGKIGTLKKDNNVAVLQNTRWTEILSRMAEKGNSKGLNPEFVERFYKDIHQESINHQEKIING
ncbi:3-deoxy-7-phosphoheptulonate synthase [Elysia marginata]|uniref:3-deoxy-7-phosphoheptulonate synthase n=1 Tax=Elysia marginata TaxID=1093978 RepID=A0AAV4EXV9_9GAST|nr:3-deoxy-7-phosphoheptulonate synthase [Elysia marginata]